MQNKVEYVYHEKNTDVRIGYLFELSKYAQYEVD